MNWFDSISQIYLAMLIGFGLGMGVTAFIGVFKLVSMLAEYLTRRSLDIKPFTFNSKKGSKVIFQGKTFKVHGVECNALSETTTFTLVGIDNNQLITISYLN